MPVDPAQGFPTTPEARTADAIADLRRRVQRLEGSNPSTQSGAGAPTASAAGLRTGTAYIDTSTNRLYYVVAGAWKFVALA